MNKLFIVGCSRSGTSIIQREVVKVMPLYSLPETAFFAVSKKDKENRIWNLKRLLIHTKLFVPELVNVSSLKSILSSLELLGINANSYIDKGIGEFDLFEDIMNRTALLNKKEGWVEKTPLHFRCTDLLLNKIESSKVLYVVRNGLDVAASIRHRAMNYSEFKHQYDINFSINLWNESVKKYNSLKDDPRVVLFNYDDFVKDNDNYMSGVISKLGFDFKLYTQNDSIDITLSSEGWKAGLSQKVSPQPSRAKELFSDDEIKEINSRLIDLQ